MIIQIKNRQVANFPMLLRLVLRSIYEPEKMRTAEFELMERSIVSWSQHERLEDVQRDFIEGLAVLLRKNQDGGFDKRKAMFKEKGIDWKKFHRLPEAYTLEGRLAAQAAYQDYAAKNPEQEDMGGRIIRP